jgi:kanosamine-6-phosphate phosphatase
VVGILFLLPAMLVLIRKVKVDVFSISSATPCEGQIGTRFRMLPNIPHPKRVVFCDFDETYFAHEPSARNIEAQGRLEDYLAKKCLSAGILFGFVTGSSLGEVLQKMERSNLALLPHFIASDLGTEITYFDRNAMCLPDLNWQAEMAASGFTKEAVERIAESLRLQGVLLKPQPEVKVAAFKKSYYLENQGMEVDRKAISLIHRWATAHSLGLNISRCNPKAGDPVGSYDIDFIPRLSGKEQVVHYMLSRYGLIPGDAYAFGESGNDVPMLKAVGNGFLVANATEEAKSLHDLVAPESYAEGILQVLEQAF